MESTANIAISMQPIMNMSVQLQKFGMKTFLLIFILHTFSFLCAAQQLKESEVPANVKAVASKQTNSQPVTMWVLDKKRSKYIASVISNTAVKGIEITLDGEWIKTTEGMLAVNVPSSVMKAATEGFPNYKLSNFFYITSPAKSPYYTIDASADEEDLTLSIDNAGKILEKKPR
jgi:hypothetical protein